MTAEDPPRPELREVKWIFPKDLEDGQAIFIHVQGFAICPYFDYHGDGLGNFGSHYYQGMVQRISDENGDLIAVQIGMYVIPDYLLDHPRVTALIEQ